MRILLASLVVAASLIPVYAQEDKKKDEKTLHDVTSKDGRFSVKMMAEKPTTSSQKVKSDVGEIEMKIVASESADKSQAILVLYNDYPDKLFESKEPKKILEDVLEGSTKNVKMIKNSDIKLGKHPGIEYEAVQAQAEGKPDMHFHTRAYLVGNRLYQVMVIGDKDFVKANGKDVHASFKLDEKK